MSTITKLGTPRIYLYPKGEKLILTWNVPIVSGYLDLIRSLLVRLFCVKVKTDRFTSLLKAPKAGKNMRLNILLLFVVKGYVFENGSTDNSEKITIFSRYEFKYKDIVKAAQKSENAKFNLFVRDV